MSHNVGILTIEVVEAKFTRSTDLIRKMDPYVAFVMREQEWKTATDGNGHKKPKWEGQTWDIEVKYLGDDLTFVAYDHDKIGHDEEIGKGDEKLSAFACYEDWDEWFSVQHKGKPAGKIHLRSTWKPTIEEKHAENDEMGQITNKIKELAQKKRDLTDEYNQIKEDMDRHEEEGNARLEAENAEEGDPEKWDKKTERAEKRCVEDHERVQVLRDAMGEKKEEFEAKLEYETNMALKRKDEFVARMECAVETAASNLEADLAKAEDNRAACEEDNHKREEEMRNRCEALNGAQRRREEAIKDEIRETAEKLLKINERIAEHLQALTEL
jgi:hypothetical protein